MPPIPRPVLSIVALCLLCAGCMVPVRREAVVLEPRPRLLHVPGITGDSPFDKWFLGALRTGGFDAEAETFDWTTGRFALTALRDHDAARVQAKRLATRIVELHKASPGRPIYLTCHSGGCGVVAWALEALPADVGVAGVIMLAPALSPGYDLEAAARRVRQEVLVYTSPWDALILGLGTTLFGTIDGPATPAAGMVGPSLPGREGTSQKVVVRSYQCAWAFQYGHTGGHMAALGVRFASGDLAAELTQRAEAMAARAGG